MLRSRTNRRRAKAGNGPTAQHGSAQTLRNRRVFAFLAVIIVLAGVYREPLEVALFGTRYVPLETFFPDVESKAPDWPITTEQAVKLLASEMTEADRNAFASLRHGDMIEYHFGFGSYVRNRFGLWRGNEELLASTGESHPDEASLVILKELNSYLRQRN